MDKISVVSLYNYLSSMQRTGSSGYQTEDDFNTNISAVTKEIFRTLLPYYAKDEQIQYLLNHLIVRSNVDIQSSPIPFPSDYAKYVDTHTGTGKIIYPRNINEKEVILSSPIDNPTIKSSEYYCFFEGRSISYLPEGIGQASLIYIRYPKEGKIRFRVVETDMRDYVEAESVEDIDFPNDMFALFSAYMLEKFGVQNRESIALEYSSLGIDRGIINIDR